MMRLLAIGALSILIPVCGQAQIIVLDPGHGYGATVNDNPDGRTATEIKTALDVGLRTKTLIQKNCAGVTVHMTRTTDINGWISVNQRAQMANNWNADRLLSIHCNAGGGTGTETFYCTVNNPGPAPDIAFAKGVQANMKNYGSWTDRRCVEDNSHLHYHLGVLRYSAAASCLNEIGFVDRPSDAAKLVDATWRANFATAYYNSLKSGLSLPCSTIPLPLPGAFTSALTPECNGTKSRIRLSWTTSANATSYQIYRNGSSYNTVISGTQFIDTAVTVGTPYAYYVRAINSAGSTNDANGTVSATAPKCSTPLPGTFTLTLTPECKGTKSQIRLNWTTLAGTASYQIYRNGSLYTTVTLKTEFINTYVIAGTSYTYNVRAINTAGNKDNANGTVSVTAPNCSVTLPGTFTLTLTPECNGTKSRIRLNWITSASATSYQIYRNGSLYNTVISGTQFIDTAVAVDTPYAYYVRAINSAGSTNNANGISPATASDCSVTRPGTFPWILILILVAAIFLIWWLIRRSSRRRR